MKLYGVNTNAYANEVIAWNDLPDSSPCTCGPSWKWSNRAHKRGFVISHVCASVHYAILQISP